MTLSEYLREHKLTHEQFAQAIGATQAAVSRYVNGKRIPRPEQLRRITAFTKGRVTANDFVVAPPQQDTQSRRPSESARATG